ncbi:hypothetical protein ACF3N7_09970 [Cruoricaptor ignavus]|uniref:hypothetical protein n=1 Tax=Cruoricaptor ignavus TaxID=1118202 RepID=UPI00370D59A5
MAIPTNITAEHIEKALQDIQQNGIDDKSLRARRIFVMHNNLHLPVKETLDRANLLANGEKLSDDISYECADYLVDLGFEVLRFEGNAAPYKRR